MSTISKQNRRTFLKLGLGGIATGAVAPWVWTPRMSRATGNIPASRHNHLIVINLDGGARSVPMFNGAVDSRWNPYGTQPGAEGTDWGVGMVFDAAPHPETQALFGMAMPSLPMISNEVCVLGTVDHTPGAAAGVGNHDTARNIICSGYEGGGAGLDAIVINASGCGTTVKDYGHLLRDDPAWAERAARIAGETESGRRGIGSSRWRRSIS